MRVKLSSALAVAAVCAIGAVPATAQAANTIHVEGKVVKAKPGKATKLSVGGGQRTDDGTQPPTVEALDLYFPKQLKFQPKGFKSCSTAILEASGPDGCPAGSSIGTGKVRAVAKGIVVTPEFRLFYGGGMNILLDVRATDPIAIESFIAAKLTRTSSGPYGYKLHIPVPMNLQRPLPTLPAAITDISADIAAVTGSGKKQRSLLELGPCGSSKTLSFKAVTTIAGGGGQQEATDTAPCK